VKRVNIGIFGLGTVGQGVLQSLRERGESLKARTGIDFHVKAVCDRSYKKKGTVLKNIHASDNPSIIHDDPEIDIVLELMGGIEPAKSHIVKSLLAGQSVVTANKALLAAHGEEIFKLAQDKFLHIGFEAAVAGALPVIKTLRRTLVINQIHGIYGILNGTCNFIITKMQNESMDYDEALKLAQDKGFAEADPSFDVNGNDAGQKLALLSGIAFDTFISEDSVQVEGIAEIRQMDLSIAESMGWIIRLLGIAKISDDGSCLLRVHPAMIPENHILAHVQDEKNAVLFDSSHSGPSLIMGNGAGSLPTAAAVISDLVSISKNTEPEIWMSSANSIKMVKDYRYRFYLRFQTRDKTGVLAEIAEILAKNDISITTVHQQEGEEPVDVVVTTHEAWESSIRNAIKTIDALPIILAPTVSIRIIDQL